MNHELVVIGGGISGMTLAFYAARAGVRTLVLEKGDGPGGCLHSERLGSGFWFEMGAHTCYNSYQALIGVMEGLGITNRVRKRERVPFRLFVDGAIRPITKELRFLELLLSAPRIAFTSKLGKTVRDYYGPIVGRRNYERVFGPLFRAVPSQEAGGFPADMLFKKRERRKDVPRSFTLDGGLQTIADSIAALPGIEFRRGQEVIDCRPSGNGLRVTVADGTVIEAGHVALALPPPQATTLLAGGYPEIAASLSRIRSTPIRSLGVVVRKESTPMEPMAGVIPLDRSFFSMVSRDTVPDPEWRGFAFHYAPDISREEMLGTAAKVLGTDRFEQVLTGEVVLPSPALGHQEIVGELDAKLAKTPLLVTGNYFGGLAIEDCVLRSRQESTRLLRSVSKT
jgi:protoporphyrinogen/coproporphyrinogen III oxidase